MKVAAVVFKNTLFQAISKGFSLGVSFLLITPLLTGYLHEAGYGAYIFISSFVLFFGAISDWGTNIITVREASANEDRRSGIFGTAALLRLGLALLGFVALNVVIRVNPAWQHFVIPTTTASFVLLFLSIKTTVGDIFQTLSRYDLSAVVEVVSTTIFLLAVFWVVDNAGGLPGVMFGWVMATALAALVGIAAALRVSRISLKFDAEIARRIAVEAMPTGALLTMFTIYNRVDIVILEHLKGDVAVGIYGLAYKIYDNLVIGAAFIANSVFPHLVREFSQDHASSRLKHLYRRILTVLLLVGIAVSAGIVVFAPLIVRILGSGGFAQSVFVLRILALAIVFSYANHLTGYSLIAFGKQRVSAAVAAVALLFNVTLNVVLVPIYSYTAAAWLTVATEGLVLILSTVAVWKTVGILPSFLFFKRRV